MGAKSFKNHSLEVTIVIIFLLVLSTVFAEVEELGNLPEELKKILIKDPLRDIPISLDLAKEITKNELGTNEEPKETNVYLENGTFIIETKFGPPVNKKVVMDGYGKVIEVKSTLLLDNLKENTRNLDLKLFVGICTIVFVLVSVYLLRRKGGKNKERNNV